MIKFFKNFFSKPILMAMITFMAVNVIQAQTINVPADYPTIQEAIDAASAGDVIEVDDGTYNLSSPVLVDQEVTLTGNTTSPANVIVNAPTSGIDRDVFQVIADNVTIQGFTIQGAEDVDASSPNDGGKTNSGIAVGGDYFILGTQPLGATLYTFNWWAIGVDGITINDNIITGNSYGVFVFHSQNVTIKNNEINANPYTGDASGVWNGKGVEIYSQPAMTMQSKVVVGTALSHSSNITVENNIISNNGLFGIELNYSEEYNLDGDPMPGPFTVNVAIVDNTISDNGGVDNYPWGSFDIYRGITSNGNESDVTVMGNTISGHVTGSNFVDSSAGIRISGSDDWTIENNDISGNLRGIYAYNGSININVELNMIYDNAQGVVMEGATTGFVNFNSIYDNDVSTWTSDGIDPFGVVTLSMPRFSNNLDATCNWWGSTADADIENMVQGDVDYRPWLISDDLTNPVCMGGLIFVDEISSPFPGTAQEAIDAAEFEVKFKYSPGKLNIGKELEIIYDFRPFPFFLPPNGDDID